MLQAFRGQIGPPRQPGQTQHAVERCAQLVAGVGQERALGLVGGVGGVVGTGQLLLGAQGFGHVFDNPDRAAVGPGAAVQRLGADARIEAAAVAAQALAVQVHGHACGHRLVQRALYRLRITRGVPE